MKRIFSLILVFVICLSLSACGKSEAVTKFESLVEQIGTVSLDSEEKIKAAEEAYNVLTDEEKESVAENYAILTEKRDTFDDLVVEAQLKAEQEKRLASVVALIDAIGDVTLNSEIAIIAAEKSYAKLSDDEKAMISDAGEKLSACRVAYENAVAEQMAARAAEVSSAINAIGTVTLDSKNTIDTAKAQYNALSAEEKKLVTNYNILEAAEREYDALCEAEKQRIISEYSKKFATDSDPIKGITWYHHNNMPRYIDTRCYIIPYIGVRDNDIWICIRYNYTGSRWVFWEKLTIMADGVKYYKNPGYTNVRRDNDSDVWETYDEVLSKGQGMDTEEIKMLEAIANSKETIIRFEGDSRHYDLYVSDQDKQMISDVLALYKAMLG